MVISIIPGYSIVNLVRVKRNFSKLEKLLLYYIISYTFTAVFWSISLILKMENISVIYWISVFLLIIFSQFSKNQDDEILNIDNNLNPNLLEYLGLFFAVLFQIFSFITAYPEFALNTATDISDHYVFSLILIRAPEYLINPNYLFANSFQAAFILISNCSYLSIQLNLILLNCWLPIGLFCAAKRLFPRSKRIPIISVIFWIFLTNRLGGFSWIYYLSVKLQINIDNYELLRITNWHTLYSIWYGLVGLRYVPLTINLIFIFFTIIMLKNKRLTSRKYISLFVIIFLSMYFTHKVEAILICLIISIYSIIINFSNKSKDINVNKSLSGLLIALVLSLLIEIALTQTFFRYNNQTLFIIISGLLLFTLISFLINKKGKIDKQIFNKPSNGNLKRNSILKKSLLIAFIIVFIYSFFLWYFFKSHEITTLESKIPWYLYSNLIGIVGLLGLIGIYFLINEKRYKKYFFLIWFATFCLILGNIIGVVDIYFFETFYDERRFITYLKIPLCFLSAYSVNKIKNKIKTIQIKTKKILKTKSPLSHILLIFFIGLIFTSTYPTLALNIESRYYHTLDNNIWSVDNTPTDAEWEAIDFLRLKLDKDPYAFLLTSSIESYNKAFMAGFTDREYQRFLNSETIEMGLTQFYHHPKYTHPYIYLNHNDLEILQKNKCFFNDYSELVPLIFNNEEVLIYNASKSSFPHEESDVCLVNPCTHDFPDLRVINFEGFNGSKNLPNFSFNQEYKDHSNALYCEKTVQGEETLLRYNFHSDVKYCSIWLNFLDYGDYSYALELFGDGGWIAQTYFDKPQERIRFLEGDGAGNLTNVYDFSYNLGEWIHIAYELNYSLNIWDLYINGRLFQSGKSFITNSTNLEYLFLLHEYPPNTAKVYADRLYVGNIKNLVFPKILNLQLSTLQKYFGYKLLAENYVEFTSRWDVDPYIFDSESIILNYDPFSSYEYNISVPFAHINITKSIEDTIQKKAFRLIILNTNGYHYFGNKILSINNSQIDANIIESNDFSISLNKPVKVNKSDIKMEGVDVLASYSTSSSDKTYYILRKSYGLGEILYINIYPLINSLYLGDNLDLIKDLLNFIDLKKMEDYDYLNKYTGYVKNIILGSNATLTTPSIFISDSATYNLEIEIFNDSSAQLFNNFSHIEIKGESFEIEVDCPEIYSKDGFYIQFIQESLECFSKGNCSINLIVNNQEYAFGSVNSFKINHKLNSSFGIWLRNPIINIENIIFESVNRFFFKNSVYFSEDIKLQGKINFKIELSDNYIAISDLRADIPFIEISINKIQEILTQIGLYVFIIIFFVVLFFSFIIRRLLINIERKTNHN